MVPIVEIAYGTSFKLRGRSWMRNGKEVGLHGSKISEMVYMP